MIINKKLRKKLKILKNKKLLKKKKRKNKELLNIKLLKSQKGRTSFCKALLAPMRLWSSSVTRGSWQVIRPVTICGRCWWVCSCLSSERIRNWCFRINWKSRQRRCCELSKRRYPRRHSEECPCRLSYGSTTAATLVNSLRNHC